MKIITVFAVVLFLYGCQPEHTNPTQTNETPSTVVLEKPVPLVDVTGAISYQDRFYSHSGFITSNMPMKPIRLVPVQLLQDDVVVAETASDDTGAFNFSDIAEGDYSLRLISQSTHPSNTEITIQDNQGQTYAIETNVTVDPQNTEIEFEILFSDRVAGIFNMLDVFLTGLDFVDSLELNNATVENLNVFWQWGQNYGTYTCKTTSSQCELGAGIYVLSDPNITGDTDEFDDDILLHELSHHLEFSWQMDDSPGGAHSLTHSTLDLRLSWSEGMASAFALSAKKWMRANKPERLSMPNAIGQDYSNYYVDTLRDTAQISVDLLAASSAYYRHSTNEAAVASAVLRLQNLVGIETAWETLFNALTDNSTADTIEAYWDALVGYEQPGAATLANWQTTLGLKGIHYKLDDYEVNDSVHSALLLELDESQDHILYRNYYTEDQDWFVLNLVTDQGVLIETFDLKNGADTYIALYNSNYELVASNDDAFDCESLPGNCSPLHDGSNFSSQISFVSSVTDSYFLQVKTAESVLIDPVNYGYIGRYGSYSIRMTELP